MKNNRRVGAWGERAAAEYLESHGYLIVERNLRTPHGEIDLLVRKEDFTVFVEVKTRTSSSLGPPEIAVTRQKQAHMIACAEHYAQQNGIDHWQIDVISVQMSAGQTQILHFENAVF